MTKSERWQSKLGHKEKHEVLKRFQEVTAVPIYPIARVSPWPEASALGFPFLKIEARAGCTQAGAFPREEGGGLRRDEGLRNHASQRPRETPCGASPHRPQQCAGAGALEAAARQTARSAGARPGGRWSTRRARGGARRGQGRGGAAAGGRARGRRGGRVSRRGKRPAAEGGEAECWKRSSALGLVPSQPFSVQPNSRLETGANQGCIGGLCLASANDRS